MIDLEQEAERILKYENLNARMLSLEIKDLMKRIEDENEELIRNFRWEIEKVKCDVRGTFI